MARSRNRKHPLQTEIPLLLRIQERQNETTRSSIHMDRNIITRAGIEPIESKVQSLDIIVHTSPCDTRDRNHADRILITHLDRLLHIQSRMTMSDRHSPHLNLPKLTELLPDHLIGTAHHKVRLIIRLTLSLATLPPSQPGSHTAEHTSLRRTDTHSTGLPITLLRSMPHVCNHIDAPAAHYSHSRILSLIDIIDTHSLIHQLRTILIHICSHKRSQVQTRLGLWEGLILNYLIGNVCRSLVPRNEFRRSRLPHFF